MIHRVKLTLTHQVFNFKQLSKSKKYLAHNLTQKLRDGKFPVQISRRNHQESETLSLHALMKLNKTFTERVQWTT